MLPTIATAVGVRESGRLLLDDVRQALADKDFLLVLDNFEHVLDAAVILPKLLDACPAVTVLATSRSPLRISGEHVLTVPTLGLPPKSSGLPLAELHTFDAIQLFVDRAREVRHDFELATDNAVAVVEICWRLDALPLAIELAARRIFTLAPHQILTRLARRLDLLVDGPREVPERQQTLRATIDGSYQLLGHEQRRLFHRLAVFAGGWTTAGGICRACPTNQALGTSARPAVRARGARSCPGPLPFPRRGTAVPYARNYPRVRAGTARGAE